MKLLKRLTCIVLAFALMFGFPVAARGEEADPAMPVITKQPENIGVLPGEEFTLSVEAYIPNGDAVGYQWHVANPFNVDISGATGPALTQTTSAPMYGTQVFGIYYCIIYNADKGLEAGSVLSGRAEVSQRPLSEQERPVITKQPRDIAVFLGEEFTLSVEAHIPNGDAVGYQWYFDTTYNSRMQGETGPSFTRVLSQDTAWTLYCVVYNADKGLNAGSVISDHATASKRVLTEEQAPVITKQPQGLGVNSGREFTLSVEAHIPNGDKVGYQWRQLATSAIYGEGPVLTITANQHSGGNYYCVVYNADMGLNAGSVNSAEAIVKVTVVPPTAREQMNEMKEQLKRLPSLREGMASDPLYLINGVISSSSLRLMISVLWFLSLFRVPPGRFESQAVKIFQNVAHVTLIPVLVIYILLFALPVSFLMLPFRGRL